MQHLWSNTQHAGAISQAVAALNQWLQIYVGNPQVNQPGQRPGIVFENTTIGSLSTDGEFAYAVEDLVVPPPAEALRT